MRLTLITLSLVILSLTSLSNTLAVYGAENGGSNLCLGNFCYHLEGADL
tara:strand:+ start:544 stop:690 length:147 start_codon:yes stop_codon:yes gene_type:complete